MGYADIVYGYPDVGGRFSAISPFGLFPALLMGCSAEEIIESAREMSATCFQSSGARDNPGAVLGAVLVSLVDSGKDLIELYSSRKMRGMNAWVEQLLAESTGKNNKGLWPLCPLDELFRPEWALDSESGVVGRFDATKGKALKPESSSVSWDTKGIQDIGGEVYRWEVATAAAAALLEIPPFNEPDVAVAKGFVLQALERLRKGEGLPWPSESMSKGDLTVLGVCEESDTPRIILDEFIEKSLREKGGLTFLVYMPQTQEVLDGLQKMVVCFEERWSFPLRLAFGPQYLHASGQLHKGGSDRSGHLILSADASEDLVLSEQGGVSMGDLALSQALADAQALESRGRRVLHLHCPGGYGSALDLVTALL